MARKKKRDMKKAYSHKVFAAKLLRWADALKHGKRFSIQVAGERITIPAHATISIEHERSGDSEELEFQLTWNR